MILAMLLNMTGTLLVFYGTAVILCRTFDYLDDIPRDVNLCVPIGFVLWQLGVLLGMGR